MSLKQWIAVDRVCHPKSSQHSQTQPTTLDPALPVTVPEAQQQGDLPMATTQPLAENCPDGIAQQLQDFRLSCPD